MACVWVHPDVVYRLRVGDSELVTTDNHPFWDVTDQAWEPAAQLDVGDLLRTPTGTAVVGGLTPTTAIAEPAYNLTVTDTHTYYVVAGSTPVLVHNTGPGCGAEYFNSYGSGGSHGIIASVDEDGILNTVITAGGGSPSGSAMFSDAMDAVGSNVRGVRGRWVSGSGKLRDNLDSFNAGIQTG